MDPEGAMPIQYSQEAGSRDSYSEDSGSTGPWVDLEDPHPQPPRKPRAGSPDPDYVNEEQVIM